MDEYRRDIPHNPKNDYWFVELGPIPDQPDWHMKLYEFQAYPFPRLEAARKFAFSSRERYWKRDISIRFPDGTREEIPHV